MSTEKSRMTFRRNIEMPNCETRSINPICSCHECDSVICFSRRRGNELCTCNQCKNFQTCLLYTKDTINNKENQLNKSRLDQCSKGSVNIGYDNLFNQNEKSVLTNNRTAKCEVLPNDCENIDWSEDISIGNNEHVSLEGGLKEKFSTAKLSAQIMDLPYTDFKESLSRNKYDFKKTTLLSKFDIFERLKEVYKACTCKVCECIVGKSLPTESKICDCKPCDCNDCKKALLHKNVNTVLMAGCPCVRCVNSKCTGIIKKPGEQTTCYCEPNDFVSCVDSFSKSCDCEPCQCIECRSFLLPNKNTQIIASVEEDSIQRNACNCQPCDCIHCRGHRASPRLVHEIATGLNRHQNCHCETCVDDSCVPDAIDTCKCERRSHFMRKPVPRDTHEFDIHHAMVTNEVSRRKNLVTKDTRHFTTTMFTALTNDYTKYKTNAKPHCNLNNCVVNTRKSLNNPRFLDLIEFGTKTSNIGLNRSKHSTFECQFCSKRQKRSKIHSDGIMSNTCKCDICECSNCKGLTRPISTKRNVYSPKWTSKSCIYKGRERENNTRNKLRLNNARISNAQEKYTLNLVTKEKLLTSQMCSNDLEDLIFEKCNSSSYIISSNKNCDSSNTVDLNNKAESQFYRNYNYDNSTKYYTSDNLKKKRDVFTYNNTNSLNISENNSTNGLKTTQDNSEYTFSVGNKSDVNCYSSKLSCVSPEYADPASLNNKYLNTMYKSHVNMALIPRYGDIIQSNKAWKYKTADRVNPLIIDVILNKDNKIVKEPPNRTEISLLNTLEKMRNSKTNNYPHKMSTQTIYEQYVFDNDFIQDGSQEIDKMLNSKFLSLNEVGKTSESLSSLESYNISHSNEPLLNIIRINECLSYNYEKYKTNRIDYFQLGKTYQRIRRTLREAKEFSLYLANILTQYEKADSEFASNFKKLQISNYSLLNKKLQFKTQNLLLESHGSSNNNVRNTHSNLNSHKCFDVKEIFDKNMNHTNDIAKNFHIEENYGDSNRESTNVEKENFILKKSELSAHNIRSNNSETILNEGKVDFILTKVTDNKYVSQKKCRSCSTSDKKVCVVKNNNHNETEHSDLNKAIMKNVNNLSTIDFTTINRTKSITTCDDGGSSLNICSYAIADNNNLGEIKTVKLTQSKERNTLAIENKNGNAAATPKQERPISSCDGQKVSNLRVRRVSDHTVMVKWTPPQDKTNIQRYEILIDGREVQKLMNPSKCMAVVTCLPRSEVLLTVKTIVPTVSNCGNFPTSSIVCKPSSKLRNKINGI